MSLSAALIAALLALAALAFWAFRQFSNLRVQSDKTRRHFSEELKQKAADAEEGRRRIAAILESMTEGVMVVAPDDRVLLVNTSLVAAFGFSRRDVEGRFYWEALRDSEVNRLIRESLKDRRPLHEEQSVSVADAVFEIQVSPVFNGPDFLGVAAVFHDVTRVKEYERLRQEFVANVSHELKTPLTSILGYVETLKEGAIDDAENRMRFLAIIEDHSLKLHRLIENLLLLSRMESASTSVRREKLSLRTVVEKAMEMVARPAAEKKLTLSLDVPAPLTVEAEAASFERALLNLLENAVKYNVEGGSIRITAGQADGETRLEIADTGIGIAESDLPRIFERFYRAERSRSSESGGSGLGLSIAKHILERHGGRIEVESTLSKGSIFTVVLPS
jgi:two-component system phosphate regulon sensor histidine kinase PhoR